MHRVYPTVTRLIKQYTGIRVTELNDTLAVEEPLEIILDYPKGPVRSRLTLAVTMRSPGNDEELAAGFLFSEGLIKSQSDMTSLMRDHEAPRPDNAIIVSLARAPERDPDQLHRHFFTNSSCGVCGKTSMQALELLHRPALIPNTPCISFELIRQLPACLREQQQQFSQTGGVHAAALFSTTGELLLLKEDVGRHNALDKLIGQLLLDERLTEAQNSLLLVSGRSSFELVQKALMADIPCLAAIGAPTSLAVQLAQRHQLTLLGFLKPDSFNVYSAPERII